MINLKYFFKGFASIKGVGSPAIALGASFIAIGALLKNLGFSIQESIFSTFLTYALPGSLVMAESMFIGASLINIFIAVWLVNARLYPMTVSLMPLLMHKNQPRWNHLAPRRRPPTPHGRACEIAGEDTIRQGKCPPPRPLQAGRSTT